MIKIALVGVGPIGRQIARYASERESIEITAAVDPDPQKAGKTLSKLVQEISSNVIIEEDLTSALGISEAEVAVVATVSDLSRLKDQVKNIAGHGLHIVSTCEQLTHPWNTHAALANEIDDICKKNGVACLGTGVNPGFLMDYLPSVFTSVCQEVEKVSVKRIQDASNRRKPFRDKIGAGLTRTEFEDQRNSLSHIGLPESAYMIAEALGWNLDKVEESLEPIISDQDILDLEIQKGDVCGLEQVVRAYCGDRELIHLLFRATVENEPRDVIHILGKPEFTSVVEGGINGDIATAAIIVNAVRSVVRLKPGLHTMLDIPVASNFE